MPFNKTGTLYPCYIICSWHFVAELYALPGIRDMPECRQHAHRWARGLWHDYNSCFGTYCKEDFMRPNLQFVDAFLTASGCNSLHELKKGSIELFQESNFTYYYCRLVWKHINCFQTRHIMYLETFVDNLIVFNKQFLLFIPLDSSMVQKVPISHNIHMVWFMWPTTP